MATINENTWVKDIYIMLLDGVQTEIGPQGGRAQSSDGEAIIEMPQGALEKTITVNLSPLQRGRALPGPLPRPSVFTYALFINGDKEVELHKPARLLLLNTIGFDPGSMIPVGTYEKSTHRWEDAGMCRVTDDGQYLEYFCTHFSSYDLNNGRPFPGGKDGAMPQVQITAVVAIHAVTQQMKAIQVLNSVWVI